LLVAVHSGRGTKWLNIVLNLNGVLYQCVERATAVRRGRSYHLDQHIYFARIPTLIGRKCVYCRPRLHEFLDRIFDLVAHIVVWNSMRRETVELIADFLFHDLPPPYAIFGHNHCQTINNGAGQTLYSRNRDKPMFLKIMSQHLFSSSKRASSFNVDNTLLIDDSLEKDVCNDNGSVLFLNSWSRDRIDCNFLMDMLAPWLDCLSSSCLRGQLTTYVDKNRIGQLPLSAQDQGQLHMMEAISLSERTRRAH